MITDDKDELNLEQTNTPPLTQADHEEQYHFDATKKAYDEDRKLRGKQYGSATDFGRAIISKALIFFTEDGEAKTCLDSLSYGIETEANKIFNHSHSKRMPVTKPLIDFVACVDRALMDDYSEGSWSDIAALIILKIVVDACLLPSNSKHVSPGSAASLIGDQLWLQLSDCLHSVICPGLRKATQVAYDGETERTEMQGLRNKRFAQSQAVGYINKRLADDGTFMNVEWPDEVKTHVGLWCLGIVYQYVPGFFEEAWVSTYKGNGDYRKVLKASHRLIALHANKLAELSELRFDAWPLREEPYKWQDTGTPGRNNRTGGYHTERCRQRNPIVRGHDQSNTIPSALCIDFLNRLGSVEYAVDARVSEAIDWSLSNHRAVDGLRVMPHPTVEQMQKGMPFAQWPFNPPPGWIGQKKDWIGSEQWKSSKTVICNRHSLLERKAIRSTLLNYYSGQLVRWDSPIWFSWSIDTRGRSYAQQSICQPQGFPAERCLFLFGGKATDQELTPEGHREVLIAIGGALNGTRSSYDERITAAKASLKDLISIVQEFGPAAPDKLETMGADEPWKLFVLLSEYDEAVLKKEHGWRVGLEIDACQSGLSILSGLQRDKIGMAATNALPNEGAPSDAYQLVCNEALKALKSLQHVNAEEVTVIGRQRKRDQDGLKIEPKEWIEVERQKLKFEVKDEKGEFWLQSARTTTWLQKHHLSPEYAQRLIDALSHPKARALCKPCVLQSIYGSSHTSRLKATKQALEDKGITLSKPTDENPEEVEALLQAELTSYVYSAAQRLFPKAYSTLRWIRQAIKLATNVGTKAKQISKQGLTWELSDGMKLNHRPGMSNCKSIKSFAFGSIYCPINYTKEINLDSLRSAGAPNFVHSIDSLMLRYAFGRDWDRPVFSIHDACQVLPNDLAKARKNLAAAYVKACSENSLDALGNQIGVSAKLLTRPDFGDANINDSLDAHYLYN